MFAPRNINELAWNNIWREIGEDDYLSQLANLASTASYFESQTQRGTLQVYALERAMDEFGFRCNVGDRKQHRDACIQRLIDEHATKKNPAEPANRVLYNKVVSDAKKKFDVWPSIYASSWVVREYKKRGGQYKNPLTGLDKWFAEEWVDLGRSIDSKGHVKKWVKCGRPDASQGKYPKCVPIARAKKMTPKQRLDAVKRKRAAEKLAPKSKGRKPIMVKANKKTNSKRAARRGARKNPPINLDYLDKMMGKGVEKEKESERHPFLKKKEEDKRIKAFLRELMNERGVDLHKGWEFTYDPDLESYKIKNDLYGSAEFFDTFEEAAARLKFLNEPIWMGESFVSGTLDAPDAGESAVDRDSNAANSFYERFGRDERFDVAFSVYNQQLKSEFNANARNYLPPGFTAAKDEPGDYEILDPDGKVVASGYLEEALDKAWEIYRGPIDNPKRKGKKKRSKNKAKKSMSKRKSKKNPSEFLPVVMHTGKGYIGDKQALYTVAGSGEKSLYDVNVFARRDGGRVVQRLEESWSTRGEDPEEAAKLAFARMVQDTGISVETRTRTEGMIPQKNPKKKRVQKSPSRKLIDGCRKKWDSYCKSPTKTNLKKVFDHLEKMSESAAKSVKDERRKCMRAAKAEAKSLGLKI